MPSEEQKNQALHAVKTLIGFIGDDPGRAGLLETPDRVLRAYQEMFAGYAYSATKNPNVDDPQKFKDLLKIFEGEGAGYDEMVCVKGIPFHSFCEHHMLPFSGTVDVAYLPKDHVVGLSKIPRVVEVYARRLQIQERMTRQIADCLNTYLDANGAACVVKGQHSCMSCRGVRKPGIMVTSCMLGEFRDDEKTRAEFLALTRG